MNCGPIWDFNLTYGNADYVNGWSTTGFQYLADLGGDYWQNPFWWNKLMRDPLYVKSLKKRWALLRNKELTNQRINFVTDSLVSLITEAQVRNYQRWPILGQYAWPNYYVGPSYTSEVKWMKDWVAKRLTYLDQQWPFDLTGTGDQLASQTSLIFPNPFTDRLTVQLVPAITDDGYVEIFSTSGSLLRKSSVDIQNGQLQLEFSGKNTLTPGLYVLRITCNNRILLTEKVLKSF